MVPFRTQPSQSVKGEGWTEFKDKSRSRCVHTLMVAIFLRKGEDTTGFRRGGGAGTAGGGGSGCSGGSSLPRTPQALLTEDPSSFNSKVQDMLVYMSRHPFPPNRPPGLSRVVAEAGTKFTVSQQKCTCGRLFDDLGDEDAKLITEVRARSCFVSVRNTRCKVSGKVA